MSNVNGAEYARHEYFKRLFLYNTFLKETHYLKKPKSKLKCSIVNAYRRQVQKIDGRTESQMNAE